MYWASDIVSSSLYLCSSVFIRKLNLYASAR